MGSQEASTTMVKLQFPQVETDKEVQAPILKTRTVPRVLPVTIRDARRQHEDDKAMSMMSFLATCLLFTGFLMVLFSVKTVWDLKIENWRLVKENAALKKTVRDNVLLRNSGNKLHPRTKFWNLNT